MCRLRIGWVGLLAGLPLSLCLCLSGSCWLQAASPIIHPHQHTRVLSPAPAKFLTIHTHRLTHPHTHSRSVTLTLNTITYAFIHSLTYSLTHSFTHSPPSHAFPHSQTHHIRTPTLCKPWHAERQQTCDTCCWLAHVPCAIPNPQLPGELGQKHMQAVHSASGRLTITDSQPSEAGINAIGSSQKPIQDHPVGELLEGSILVLARRKEGH